MNTSASRPTEASQAGSSLEAPPPPRVPLWRQFIQLIRSRIVGGLIAALPIALTLFIVSWLYNALTTIVLTPAIEAVRYVLGNHGLSQTFWYTYFAPVLAILLVLSILYMLGVFVRLRMMRAVDWVMLQVPVVSTIFKAVSNVVESLGQQLQGNQGFKRVVLVEFPHPGMKSLAFVTNTLRDTRTGQTILCVCVLTGVMPPAGFTMFVPEESVVDVDWTMNQTLQAILSGGITSPTTLQFFGNRPDPRAVVVDANPASGGSTPS